MFIRHLKHFKKKRHLSLHTVMYS